MKPRHRHYDSRANRESDDLTHLVVPYTEIGR